MKRRMMVIVCVLFSIQGGIALGRSFLATVVRLPRLTGLTRSAVPPSGYAIRFYDIGAKPAGGQDFQGVSLYSPYRAYVTDAVRRGAFLILANSSPGNGCVAYKYLVNPARWTVEKKFPWRALIVGSQPASLMVGADGSDWVWCQGRKGRFTLRIFRRKFAGQVGAYTLPRRYRYFASVLAGGQAVVFTDTQPPTRNCRVVVVRENGSTRTVDLTSKIGSHPKFIAAVGRQVTGMTPNGRLIEITISQLGSVSRAMTLQVVTPQRNGYVDAYTALNAMVGFCEVQVPSENGMGYSYRLLSISLRTGKITKTVRLSTFAPQLLAANGGVCAVTPSGSVEVYTPDLKYAGRLAARVGGLLKSALVKTR